MAIRLRIPKRPDKSGKPTSRFSLHDPLVKAAVAVFIVIAVVFIGIFSYFYINYDRIINRRFKRPGVQHFGQDLRHSPDCALGRKNRAARNCGRFAARRLPEKRTRDSPLGSFRLLNSGIEVRPGPQSYHSPEPATIRFSGGKVDTITGKNGELGAYELEPEMITSLFDAGQRSKRQLVKYDDIPKVLVDAVVSIEDRRFLPTRRREFHSPGGSRMDRLHPPTAPAGRIDPDHAAFAGIFSHPGKDLQAQGD